MADDKKERGKDSGREDKQPRRVITHHGKKKDSELPEEIKPNKPGEVLSDPINLGVNPAKHLKKPAVQAEHQVSERQTDNQAEELKGERSPTPKAPTSPPPTQPPPQNSGHWFISFAFLLSLAALGIVAVVSFVLYQTQQEIQVLHNDMAAEQNAMNDLIGKAELALREVKTLQEKNNTSQSDLAVLKQEVEEAQVKFIALTGKKEWVLNEVEYLVQNAAQQILINQDLMTALSQLELADQKVKQLGHPGLTILRDALSQDIVKLKAVQKLDKEGLWSQLNAILSQLPMLRFKMLIDEQQGSSDVAQAERSNAYQAKWQVALHKSWDEIKNLIRVSRYDQEQIQPVLVQHEKIQLLRAMQYMVEQAKWGVLKRENTVFQEALNNLSQNMQLFFEKDNIRENLLVEIKKVAAVNVSATQPNLDNSLQAVQEALSISGPAPSSVMEGNG